MTSIITLAVRPEEVYFNNKSVRGLGLSGAKPRAEESVTERG